MMSGSGFRRFPDWGLAAIATISVVAINPAHVLATVPESLVGFCIKVGFVQDNKRSLANFC